MNNLKCMECIVLQICLKLKDQDFGSNIFVLIYRLEKLGEYLHNTIYLLSVSGLILFTSP